MDLEAKLNVQCVVVVLFTVPLSLDTGNSKTKLGQPQEQTNGIRCEESHRLNHYQVMQF